MAVLFPIFIKGETGGKRFSLRFFTNPTKISVQKRSQISEVRTMNGTTFQVWPDLPDTVKFEGVSFGIRSLLELQNMSKIMEQDPESKEVTLSYKYRTYKGYIKDLNVSMDADKPRQFKYNLDFISKDRFALGDMAIGQLTGLKAELDFIQAQLRGAKGRFFDPNGVTTSETAVNAAAGFAAFLGPTAAANAASTIAGQIGNVGQDIGRSIKKNVRKGAAPNIKPSPFF